MSSRQDQNNKIQEVLRLNKTKNELSKEATSIIDQSKEKITDHDDYYLTFIRLEGYEIDELITMLIESNNDDFEFMYLLTKPKLESFINKLKILLDRLKRPKNESIKLIKILKQILNEQFT